MATVDYDFNQLSTQSPLPNANTIVLQFPTVTTTNQSIIIPTVKLIDMKKHQQLERIMTGDSNDNIIDHRSTGSNSTNTSAIQSTIGFISHRSYSTGINTHSDNNHNVLSGNKMNVIQPIHVLSPSHTRVQRSMSHNTNQLIQHSPTYNDSITKIQGNTFTPQSSQSDNNIDQLDNDKENDDEHMTNVQPNRFQSPPINQIKKNDLLYKKRKKSTTPKQLHHTDISNNTLNKRTLSQSSSLSPSLQHSTINDIASQHNNMDQSTATTSQRKPATLFQFFGKPEPTSNKLHRQSSNILSAQHNSNEILLNGDSVESLDTYSPIQQNRSNHSTNKFKQSQHNNNNKKQRTDDTTTIHKLQQQLHERENALQLREYQLTQKEREYEIRFNSAKQQQLIQCNTQITIESLEHQLHELQSEYDEYRAKVTTVLSQTLIEAAELRQHDMEEKLIRDKFRIGQVVSHREGHVICDVWENGEAYRELKLKIERLEKQRDELDQIRKKLNKKKLHAKKLCIDINDNINTSISSTNEFRKPQSVDIELNLEMDEVYKVKSSLIKKDLDSLRDDERQLDILKKTMIRQQKLWHDQQSSRFNTHCIFESRYILIEMLGKGGFSEVYKAFDMKQMIYVACKIHQLNTTWSNEKKLNYTKHATREYNIHRNLSHSRVVKLYDVFAIDFNSFCTVLEYCNGNDLDYYLKNRLILNEREARAIIMQVFSGLKYLNEQKYKIIHYDLKPGMYQQQ